VTSRSLVALLFASAHGPVAPKLALAAGAAFALAASAISAWQSWVRLRG
jgi:hypothetical protein